MRINAVDAFFYAGGDHQEWVRHHLFMTLLAEFNQETAVRSRLDLRETINNLPRMAAWLRDRGWKVSLTDPGFVYEYKGLIFDDHCDQLVEWLLVNT